MKNLIFIIALFLGFNANSQSYKIIGDDYWINAMFYFEVTDSYNGSEMRGVEVELFDGRVLIAKAYTNSRGAALFIIKGPRFLEDNMSFRIRKDSYSTWTHTLEDQWDVLQYMKKNQIGIRYKDNRGLNQLRKPTSRTEDIAHILNGNFSKFNGSAGGYGGTKYPGMMQFKVSLNYDRHPSERRGHNSGSRNTNNNSNPNQGSYQPQSSGGDGDYNGWKRSMSRGTIVFEKESCEVKIHDFFAGSYYVSYSLQGGSSFEAGSPSKMSEAISLARQEMNRIDRMIVQRDKIRADKLLRQKENNAPEESTTIKNLATNGWRFSEERDDMIVFVKANRELIIQAYYGPTHYSVWNKEVGVRVGENILITKEIKNAKLALIRYMRTH